QRLSLTRHVRQLHERFEYRPLHAPVVVSANSSRLSEVVGDGWLAAGDAAVSFDPLSSQGILSAMSSGQQAADAVCRWMHGDRGAVASYAAGIAGVSGESRDRRARYYAIERRWPGSPFWQRRSPAN